MITLFGFTLSIKHLILIAVAIIAIILVLKFVKTIAKIILIIAIVVGVLIFFKIISVNQVKESIQQINVGQVNNTINQASDALNQMLPR